MKNFKLLFFILLTVCFFIGGTNVNANELDSLPLDVQAIILSKQGNNTKALSLINKAIKQEPNNYGYYNNRGIIKENLEDYNGAIADYSYAIKLNPTYEIAYNNRGNLYKKLNKGILAAVDLSKYATLKPSYDSYTSLGYLMLDGNQNYKNAIEFFTKAISYIQPEIDKFNKKVAEGSAFGKMEMSEFEGAYYGRGVSYYLMKDSSRAIQDFNKAISCRTFNPDAYFFRGLAKISQGDKASAFSDLNVAKQQYQQDANQIGYNKTLEIIQQIKGY